MSTTFLGVSGTRYTVGNKDPKKGGEGTIYFATNGKVIKIYHKEVLKSRYDLLRRKITYMYEHPPSGRMLPFLAWPIDIINDSQGRFSGFVMNPLADYKEFGEYYFFKMSCPNPQDFLASIAFNLCLITHAIHQAGYIIGDFNPANIGCRPVDGKDPGSVCLYDNDSFQFVTDKGEKFKCEVQCANYVAPEIFLEVDEVKKDRLRRGKDPSGVTMADLDIGWTQNTDNFALAVHIFQLLFNGYHPYDSKKSSDTKATSAFNYAKSPSCEVPPPINESVKRCCYMFGKGYRPYGKHVPDHKQFPGYIMSLFERAFSKSNFGKPRPTALEWKKALYQYANEVRRCNAIKEHIYWRGATCCPYCAAIGTVNTKVSVSFNVQGIGNPVQAMRVDKGATITLPMAGPSTEYDLKGWKSASGKEYPVGYRFQVKEPTTFSAVWVPSTFTMRFTFYFYYAALLHRKKRMEISVRNCYSNGVAYNTVKRTTNPMKDSDAYEMTMVCANSSSTVEITVAIEGSNKKSKITVAPSTSTSINVWINRSGNLDLNESYY